MSGPLRAPSDRPRVVRVLEDERFLRGIGIGALIGAAIAGSTIWARIRGRRGDNPQPSAAAHDGPPITH